MIVTAGNKNRKTVVKHQVKGRCSQWAVTSSQLLLLSLVIVLWIRNTREGLILIEMQVKRRARMQRIKDEGGREKERGCSSSTFTLFFVVSYWLLQERVSFLPSTFHCKVWSQKWKQSSRAESCCLVGVQTRAFQPLDSFHDHLIMFTCILTADATDGRSVQYTLVHWWDWQNELEKKYNVQAVQQYPCECYSLSLCVPIRFNQEGKATISAN